MTRLLVVFVVFLVAVMSQLASGQVYSSCQDLKSNDPGAVSGVYTITPLPQYPPVQVYCEMEISGGGYTFLPGSLTRRGNASQIVGALFTDKQNVLLKLQKESDQSEYYTLIQPHPSYAQYDFGLLVNGYSGYTRPQNDFMHDYYFLGIIPRSAAAKRNVQGFRSNGVNVQFHNCDSNPNSLFAFLPNHPLNGIPFAPSNYHPHLVYEGQGVAVEWRRQAKPVIDRTMPQEYFFLTELHFGGCGCYTSSNRWTKFGYHATAIGIR